jgi:hypothetical protein
MPLPGWCGGDAVAGVVRRRRLGDAAAGVVRRRLGDASTKVSVYWAGPLAFCFVQEDDALCPGVIQLTITPWAEAPYYPAAGPASPTWLVNSVVKASLTRVLYFSTRRPCPARYSKRLFCEIITDKVYFVLKFVQRVIFIDFAA